MKQKKNSITAKSLAMMVQLLTVACFVLHTSLLVSCSDILETESELVAYEKDHTLNHPTDSLYSVMGIINRMQIIADRTVLLGELRSDLVTTTDAASADLKRLAAFDLDGQNVYNKVSDYYAVINNCNYYLAHVDTLLERRGRVLFRNEYAAVKAFRAWTYLELVKAYGQVPLVLSPVMTEREAEAARNTQPATLTDICNYFIADLTPYAEIDPPVYGSIGGRDSRYFFIPAKALLGDLCLWAGRYEEAARWYNSFLNDRENPVRMNISNRVQWTSVTEFLRPSNSYSVTGSEVLSYIPMETRVFDGTVSDLKNIYSSTSENYYYYQVTPSKALYQLSASQINCIEYKTTTSTDTVYAPRTGLTSDVLVGDLRLYSSYNMSSTGTQDPYSDYSSNLQNIYKVSSNMVSTYRSSMVYLRYAEALNRAGYPQSAFTILKYGLCAENANAYIDSLELVAAANLIKFDETIFTRENTIGVHSRGSGHSECNAFYNLPLPADSLATRQDTIDFQVPLVEDMIIDEMALEGSFEGYRFFDLMRVALHRNDPSYLANAVARRLGQTDEALRTLLLDTKNWYLPLQ